MISDKEDMEMNPQSQAGKPACLPWAPSLGSPASSPVLASLPAPPLVHLLSLPSAESQEKQLLRVSAQLPWQLSPGYRLTEML